MKNVLVISGHTDLNDSVVNKTILDELRMKIPEAEYALLDQLYPDFKIDVKTEQERLVRADIIVLQFPIFWYAMPSLLSRWIEQTFQHGFSHGLAGNKLKGKKLVVSFTTGAPEYMYSYEGARKYPIEDFLLSIKATCDLCSIELAGFVYTGGVSYRGRNEVDKLIEMKEKAMAHANKVVELAKKL